jgi:uncharacterized protein (DUF302 family)
MMAIHSRYGFGTKLNLPYATAVERTKAALKEQGFGVLTEIDVKATMKQKLDVEHRPYLILGACNPPLALRALTAEREIGLLLPCNVIVYEADDGVIVEAMDPEAALGIAESPALAEIAAEAKARLQQAMAALAGA